MISRTPEHEGQTGATYDADVLQSMQDQPSDDVLYVVKHTLYAVKLKLYVQHSVYRVIQKEYVTEILSLLYQMRADRL